MKTGRTTGNRLRSTGLGLRSTYFAKYSLNLELGHVIDPLASSDNGHHSSRLVLSGSVRY